MSYIFGLKMSTIHLSKIFIALFFVNYLFSVYIHFRTICMHMKDYIFILLYSYFTFKIFYFYILSIAFLKMGAINRRAKSFRFVKSFREFVQTSLETLSVTLSLARLFAYFIFHFLPIKETRSSYREDTFLKLAAVSNLGDINGIITRQWVALALTKLAIMREVCAFILARYASETVASRSFLLRNAY